MAGRCQADPVTPRSWTLLLALGAVWGASYMLIEIGLRDLSPAWVVFARVALAALVLAPFAIARGALAPMRGRLPLVFALAAVQVAGPFMLIGAGQEEIASSLAGILVASAPVLTALLAPFVDRAERSTGSALAGVALGITGVALLLGVDAAGSAAELVGALMVVLASLGYVIGAFVLKARFAGTDPVGIVTGTMAASAVLALPWAFATTPGDAPGAGPIAAVAALGVLGTGVAFVIYYGLIGSVGPARASVVTYVAPVFAIFYGVVVLGERVTVATFAGLALILGGSWLAAGGRAAAAEPEPAGVPPERAPPDAAAVGAARASEPV